MAPGGPSPDRQNLWILSHQQLRDPGLFLNLLEMARLKGFDVERVGDDQAGLQQINHHSGEPPWTL
ncbi:hypothetical protein DFAR_1860022 [Desulfarculales bacterium]